MWSPDEWSPDEWSPQHWSPDEWSPQHWSPEYFGEHEAGDLPPAKHPSGGAFWWQRDDVDIIDKINRRRSFSVPKTSPAAVSSRMSAKDQ